MVIDTHVHLDDERYAMDLDNVMSNFVNCGGIAVINNNCELATLSKAIELSEKYKEFYFAVGCHAHNAHEYSDEMAKIFTDVANSHSKVVAYGEIGLDYYYNFSPREVQRESLVKQIKLAHSLKLPITLHIRDAYGDALDILRANKSFLEYGAVMHCYSGSVEVAKECVKLGIFISFSGTITFKNCKLNEVTKVVPLDMVLAETDCPYLTPMPFRGQRNEPSRVVEVIKFLANCYNVDEQAMNKQLTANALKIFTRLSNSINE